MGRADESSSDYEKNAYDEIGSEKTTRGFRTGPSFVQSIHRKGEAKLFALILLIVAV